MAGARGESSRQGQGPGRGERGSGRTLGVQARSGPAGERPARQLQRRRAQRGRQVAKSRGSTVGLSGGEVHSKGGGRRSLGEVQANGSAPLRHAYDWPVTSLARGSSARVALATDPSVGPGGRRLRFRPARTGPTASGGGGQRTAISGAGGWTGCLAMGWVAPGCFSVDRWGGGGPSRWRPRAGTVTPGT